MKIPHHKRLMLATTNMKQNGCWLVMYNAILINVIHHKIMTSDSLFSCTPHQKEPSNNVV